MLNIDNKDQEELIKILEPNNSSDSLEDDLYIYIYIYNMLVNI